MRPIKSYNLAQLLMQLRFTPEKKRRKQLDAAEKLISIIDKNKEYPYEFVCFRITGYQPKSDVESELIKGDELLEDLRIFISKLSGKLAIEVTEQSEIIYGIEELAKSVGVSTKTLYRWRKQGLVGRKYIFEDGMSRLGFTQSIVEEFLSSHPELAGKAKNFSRLTDRQKQQIVNLAVKLTAETGLSRHRIIDRISTKTGKCHETIRYTLLNYENEHPDKPIFKKTTGVITPAQAAEIYRLYKQGCSIKELMHRFERNKSSIYRIINRRRAKAILAMKIEFIASDEFLEPDAKERILAEPINKPEKIVLENVEPIRLTGSSLSEYLHTLSDSPVLSRDDEIESFRQYNYLKYLAVQSRDDIKLSKVSGTLLRNIETYLSQAEEIKRRIIEANLRLVVNIARKHTLSGANLLDLVSDGNIALMNAVEKFDYGRGFRFSTFASWTIAKNYARKIPDHLGRLDKTAQASLANIHREMQSEDVADFAAIERAHKSLFEVIKNNLTEREQYVITNRFGLFGPPVKKETKTLVQIGKELDLSKERIRQIELTALQKLRQSLSPEEFELLTG